MTKNRRILLQIKKKTIGKVKEDAGMNFEDIFIISKQFQYIVHIILKKVPLGTNQLKQSALNIQKEPLSFRLPHARWLPDPQYVRQARAGHVNWPHIIRVHIIAKGISTINYKSTLFSYKYTQWEQRERGIREDRGMQRHIHSLSSCSSSLHTFRGTVIYVAHDEVGVRFCLLRLFKWLHNLLFIYFSYFSSIFLIL